MGSKVLLADDSITIQKVVGIIFANEAYDLTTVATGEDAVRKAIEITPDVLLVDALMPGKSGYEVCREIRQNPALSHIAILLMTGAFETVDEEQNRLSGADDFIVKPFDSQTLIDATNRMIALTAERKEAAVAGGSSQVPGFPETSLDDVWATGFAEKTPAGDIPEPVFFGEPVPAATVGSPVQQATADDDLWGAFDLDQVETVPRPTTPTAANSSTAADDFFSFDEQPAEPIEVVPTDEFVIEPIAEEPLQVSSPKTKGYEPVGEEEISFEESDSPQPVSASVEPGSGEISFGDISFDQPAPVTAPAAVPMPESQAPAIAPASPTEEQLRAMLASVSREVIERIVWEVVPDLAEALIREEIRKLKTGTA